MKNLPFRQVHLDFHTSEEIRGIGKNFSTIRFQEMLKLGHVNSVTVFSKCHHGWSYHPTKVGEMHPHLDFDLLGEMMAAAHEIGVKTPVYLSGGYDERIARKHTDWLWRDAEGKTWVPDFMQPGYHFTCLNSPYLEILLAQVEEVLQNYKTDGIFIDIVKPRECYCQYCMAELRRRGQDPRDIRAVAALGEEVYKRYTQGVRDLVERIRPGISIAHNNGHIRRGRRDLAFANTHLELESLPTGGWGYDHFPLSARYAQNLGLEYLGMTGKFHLSWGEFGGYKHPNALRYETSLALANGARCSIGDQLHPEGMMDEATYTLIGTAYSEVEQKEEWCREVSNIADIAVISLEAVRLEENYGKRNPPKSDVGAARILLEGKYLFDFIDDQEPLDRYKAVILPDRVRLTEALKEKLLRFTAAGGRILATGESGLMERENTFGLDLGVEWEGVNVYKPDYFRPSFDMGPLGRAAFISYSQGQKVKQAGGTVLGYRENPYFNRDLLRFCSHHHAPSCMETAGPGMVEGPSGIYIAWNVFEDYAIKGSLWLKETIGYALDRLLPEKSLSTNLPAQGITTLMHQPAQGRYVHHLLYAAPVRRGEGVEVIEDILPVCGVDVILKLPDRVKRVYLAPGGRDIVFRQEQDHVQYRVDCFECHQMVVIEY